MNFFFAIYITLFRCVGTSVGPSVTHFFECDKTRLFQLSRPPGIAYGERKRWEVMKGVTREGAIREGASEDITRGDESEGRVSGLVYGRPCAEIEL